jgi:hypothetical protein
VDQPRQDEPAVQESRGEPLEQKHRDESPAAPEKSKFPIGSILPIVALSLSVFSLYESELTRKEVARIDVIKTDYGLFHNLAQLQIQYPLMAHLFAVTGEAYDTNVERIKSASSSASKEERSKLLLEERGITSSLLTKRLFTCGSRHQVANAAVPS